jgi:hypothetical protein
MAGCLEMCFPMHLGILLRITIGLRVRGIECQGISIQIYYPTMYGLCRDAVERVSSLRRNRARQYSREIFDELVKYLNLGIKDLGGRRVVRYLWRRSCEIARHQVDLEMSDGILVPRINSISLWQVDDHV